MADPVQILEEVLAKGCGAVKFFGKINSYSFAQKERAEKVFLDALKEIASRNGEQAKKARILLDTFDDHINSTPVQRFWEEVRLRNEEAATRRAQLILAEKKKQRVFCIDSDVAEEHISSSHRLLSESKARGTPFDVSFDEYVDLGLERKRKHSVDNIPSDEEDGENSVKEVTKNHFEFGKTSPEPEEPAGSSEVNAIYRASTPSGVVPASGTIPPFSVASTNITDEIATGTDEEEFNNEHRALFVHAYGELLDEHKWRLRSGRVVEDVMFEKGLKFRYVSNIHSFCYVAGDPNITGLFTPEEREEIEAEPKSIQPFIANGTFHKFYNKFASCETANDLRKLLYGTSHEELLSDGPLQGESWHCQMYHAFLTDILLQDGRIDCFREDLSEAWLLANPFHVLQLMFNDKKNVFFLPGEKCGIAVGERKNKQRALPGMKEMARKAVGKKGDGYVRLFDGTAKDLAATEAGAQWKGAKGTKLMVESLGTLPKVLRDIWMSNVRRAGENERVLRSLAVPGLAIYGPMVAFLLLDSPKGYVTRCFVNDWKELSTTVSKETLKANGRVFLDFLLTRLHVLRNEDLIVGNAKSSEGEEEDEDPGLALLQEFSSPKRAPLAMPLSHPTPKRRKASVPGNACERRPSASGSAM